MNCRFCGNELKHEFIDLGNSPPSNSFLTKEQLNELEMFYPLKVFVCDKCFLVQIDEYKKAVEIFNREYIYFSSYSTSWLAHSKQYVDMMINKYGFNRKSFVIEIASNDGYLLQYFKEKNIPVLGIEPAESVANDSRQKGIETITKYFSTVTAKELVKDNVQADLLIGNNVLAHVPAINDFVEGLKIALKPDGIITMEFPHLVQLIENNQFDTIYHEHFSYFSFSTLKNIFKTHRLEMFDVEEIPTHGGSLRIYAKHNNDNTKKVTANVQKLSDKEYSLGIDKLSYYVNFRGKVVKVKYDLLLFLLEQKKLGKKVVAYGAAAKGNTLLNFCGIRKDLIEFVVDASPHKVGKFLPGSHIPVVPESEIRKCKPEFIIILPWNIQKEIKEKLYYIREWAGEFVVPIPDLRVI